MTPQHAVTIEVAENQYRVYKRLSDLNGMSIAQVIEAAAMYGARVMLADFDKPLSYTKTFVEDLA